MSVPLSLPEPTWALVTTVQRRGLLEPVMEIILLGISCLGWTPGPHTLLVILLSLPSCSFIPAHFLGWFLFSLLEMLERPVSRSGTFSTSSLRPLPWRSCPVAAIFPSLASASPQALPCISNSLAYLKKQFFFNLFIFCWRRVD